MGQGCRALLEPKWAGVHDLMVRLLGACTCCRDARVVELYAVAGTGVREHVEREHALERVGA